VAATAGCGVYEDLTTSDYVKESADTIFLDAVRATTAADTVRLTGWVKSGGTRMEFSLMSAAPQTCSGTISYFTADLDVRLTPDASFIKGSASTWREFPGLAGVAGRTASARLADRWIELGNDSGFQPLCDLARDLLTTKERQAVDAGKVPSNLELKHRGLSEAAGEDVARLDVVDDKSGPSEVFVSLEEPHHIVKFVQKSRKASAEVTFSDYGFPAEVEAPKGAVSLDELLSRPA
jgi:hypothetical protein